MEDHTGGTPPETTLSAVQLGVVLDALADAETYRETAGQCADDIDDLDAARKYRELSAVLAPDETS